MMLLLELCHTVTSEALPGPLCEIHQPQTRPFCEMHKQGIDVVLDQRVLIQEERCDIPKLALSRQSGADGPGEPLVAPKAPALVALSEGAQLRKSSLPER